MDLTIPQALINELGVPQIIDIRDQLPVNPNYTWAQLAGARDVNDLTTIGLHHDSLKKADTAGVDDITLAQRIARNHINLTKNEPNGDAGFPYHVWIRNGKAYLCNNIEDRTYGIASNNGYIVHVCCSGEYAFTDSLTDADRKMIIAVCLSLKAVLPSYTGIKAHCELNATDCPGYDYNGIRGDVQTVDMRLQRSSTASARKERAFAVANQAAYMYGLAQGSDGNAEWAQNWLDELYDSMKSKGLL